MRRLASRRAVVLEVEAPVSRAEAHPGQRVDRVAQALALREPRRPAARLVAVHLGEGVAPAGPGELRLDLARGALRVRDGPAGRNAGVHEDATGGLVVIEQRAAAQP